jgi:hypothetical protein
MIPSEPLPANDWLIGKKDKKIANNKLSVFLLIFYSFSIWKDLNLLFIT